MRTNRAPRTSTACRALTALSLAIFLALLPTAASAIQIPTFNLRRSDCVTVAGLKWHTDFATASSEAQAQNKMLLVNFVPCAGSNAQRELEKYVHENNGVRKELKDYVLVRVFDNENAGGLNFGIFRRARGKLINDPAFKYLGRKPGLAILDYKHTRKPYYGDVVTTLPFTNGKYYRWQNSYLAAALDLPAGTITQRTMVWAVRIHPEHPRSTNGKMHTALAAGAAKHSAYQASIGLQGHHQWESRVHRLVSQTNAGGASEVVAESWPNQGMIDSCIDCVLSWRHSSGHWGAVKRNQRYYGYDIRKGSNGIWYGTGIFAN